MKNTNKTMFFLLLTLAPSMVLATVSDELKRFNKCYAIFVGERVKTSDPLWMAVEAGTKSGTDACMEIFDKATLFNNGEISKVNGVPDAIGIKVLNTFMRFQKSQFQIPDYGSAIGIASERYTRDVIDTNEAAYHFVYSLFSPNQKFSDIVTRDYSLRAVRYSQFPERARSILNVALPALEQGTYKTVVDANGVNQTVPDNLSVFSPELIETGSLMGIVRDDIKNVITNTAYIKQTAFSFNDYNINQHIGGGAMGTQAYLLGNIGKDGFNNGGTGLYRRWGKHVMEDFLCRGLPALRTTDVINEVDSTSKIAFKTGISCMACHASMDPLAAVLRNGRTGWTHNSGLVSTRVKFFGVRTPTLGYADMPKLANETNFYQRPANGRLYYRSYDGKLVQQEMVGPQELGEKMAETNDLYVCAAKRYYKFLTGITVDLADIGNINTPEFSKGGEYQRNKVIKMGLDLKNHQSTRLLIKNIIQQKAFIYPDQGV